MVLVMSLWRLHGSRPSCKREIDFCDLLRSTSVVTTLDGEAVSHPSMALDPSLSLDVVRLFVRVSSAGHSRMGRMSSASRF